MMRSWGGGGYVSSWRKGAERRFQTEVGLKGNMNSMEEPASKGARIAFTVPWMWWSGRRWRRRSWGVYDHAFTRLSDCAESAECGRRTPFYSSLVSTFFSWMNFNRHPPTGLFVVPDV